ncbi:MAG: 1-acyl-sn-glycerol-3-phosphate acyltransferase, partial [Alphaproteobacteria bacterium]|nr:1-acyl-sn-glycerol-3-phosphate acyltransferase [Alphaproteobacteria bacterium]
GGVLVVANHTSYFDPLAVGMYLIWGAGRWPRYLGKVQLFHAPVLGWLARSCGQIPVERHSAKAKDALAAAEAALAAGKCVAIYPEGTLTGDPTLWPMKGKTGSARLALETDVPVIPVGQWGAHFFFPDEKPGFPLVLSRHHVFRVSAGDPVDLSDLRGQPVTKELLDEATRRIIDAITAQVAVLRGEPSAPSDLRRRACLLAGAALELAGRCSLGEGMRLAEQTLADGRAWAKFQRICEAQGGLREPPRSVVNRPLLAQRSGRVMAMNNRTLARLAKLAGAPDDKAAGVELHVRLGDEVSAGEPLMTVHAEARGELAYALDYAAANPNMLSIEA